MSAIEHILLISNELKNNIFLLILQLSFYITQTSDARRLKFHMGIALVFVYQLVVVLTL